MNVNFFDETVGDFTLVGNNLMATNAGPDPIFGGTTDYALSDTLQGGTNLSGYVINVGNGAKLFTLQMPPFPNPATSPFSSASVS